MAKRTCPSARGGESLLCHHHGINASRDGYGLFADRSHQRTIWSAVLNGVVAVPLTVMIMLLTSNSKIMGKFAVAGALRFVGWLATSVMGIAAIGLIITSALNYPLLVLSRLTATSSS
jgi:hypothetical protein